MKGIEQRHGVAVQLGDLAEMRAQVRRCDAEILEVIARRIRLCRAVGRLKLAAGVPIRNRSIEEIVVSNARALARQYGLEPAFAENVVRGLIEHSVACQQQLEGEVESSWPHT